MPDIVSSIKKMALDAVETSKPMQIQYGTVVSTDPLQIKLNQKLFIGMESLILTSNVMDHEIQSIIGGIPQTVMLKKAPAQGEKIILLREQGGQKYLVLDRVVNE